MRYLALSITLVLVVSAFILNFYPLSLNPNEYIFANDGDGLKNYYTALYQVKYGEDITFRGMFYPYGTHLLFGDAIPVFVYLTKSIIAVFPSALEYSTAIFNILLLSSFLLSAYLIFILLEKFSLPPFYALLATVPIVLLSPQMYRISGHYGLAYAFILPLWILLLWNYWHLPKIKYLAYIFLSCVLAIFIHPYHGLIGMVLFGTFAVTAIAFDYKENKKFIAAVKKYSAPVVAVGMAFAVFLIFMKFTDPVTDHVGNPYGLIEYRAKMEGLFVPLWGPVFDFLNSIIHIAVPGFEAYAYVGIPTTIFFVSVLVFFILKRFKKFSSLKTPSLDFLRNNIWFRNLFIASMLVYIFAMAYPMRLNMMFLLDLIPPLKQFRALGRLAWVVHYVLVFCAIVFWWQQFKKGYLENKNKKVLYVSLLLLGIWYADVYVHFYGMRERSEISENVFHSGKKSKFIPSTIDYSKYQCIAGMRFHQVGSEKMGSDHSGAIEKQVILHSYHTGLPMMDATMTRLSISQSQKLWAAFAHPALLSDVWADFPDQRDILLIRDKTEAWDSDTILHHLKKIHTTENVDYYELPVTFMKTFHKQYKEKILAYAKSLKNPENYSLHLSFHDTTGRGSEAIETSNDKVLLYQGKPKLPDSTVAELSMWVHMNYKKIAMPNITYCIYNEAGEKTAEANISTASSYDLYNGMQRYRAVLPKLNSKDSLEVSVRYENTWIDNLEIRPVDSTTFFEEGRRQWINNYPAYW